MRVRALAVVTLMALGACRDEQAGPKPKGTRAPAPARGSVETIDVAPTELTWRSGATWGQGAVLYIGSVVEPARPRPGQGVLMRHYFMAAKPPPQGYRFFMHIVDAASGQQLGNLDHEPQNGAAPLAAWPVGKIVVDEQRLEMPTYPGTLQLLLGFWNEGGRLAPDQPGSHDGQARVFGPKLEPPQEALPEYGAPKAARPPSIDGKLDDPVWATAPEVVLTASLDGRPATRKTTLRLAWDNQNLYAAFACDDPDVWGTLRKKDDPIYTEEAVEVFLDADGDGATYNELQVSPHNVNFDAAFVKRRSDLEEAMKWESGMKSAVQVRGTLDTEGDTDEGWTAELQIPIARLLAVPSAPKGGDRWRFNAYRLEHIQRRRQVEGQSFAPLFDGDFHALPRFGWLVFR